jgi:hypothetical protein
LLHAGERALIFRYYFSSRGDTFFLILAFAGMELFYANEPSLEAG